MEVPPSAMLWTHNNSGNVVFIEWRLGGPHRAFKAKERRYQGCSPFLFLIAFFANHSVFWSVPHRSARNRVLYYSYWYPLNFQHLMQSTCTFINHSYCFESNAVPQQDTSHNADLEIDENSNKVTSSNPPSTYNPFLQPCLTADEFFPTQPLPQLVCICACM